MLDTLVKLASLGAMKSGFVTLLLFCAPSTIFADLPQGLPEAIALWLNGAPGSETRVGEPEVFSGENCSNVHNPTVTP